MNVSRKDATITNTDEEFPGSFEVVLSTPSKDRDGDELALEDWKTPLPDHITFDQDHGMNVASTVGSGVPSIEDGKLIVRGTYSSLPRAQEVRTLVKEGHIRTTSVAFMSEKVTKDGKTKTVRELLNGAFVAIPSNRDSVVLGSKAGARNSQSDQAHIQAIFDHAVALGAMSHAELLPDAAEQERHEPGPMDPSGAMEGAVGGKSYEAIVKAKYSAEQLRQMLAEGHAMRGPNGEPDYPIGDRQDVENAVHAVGRGQGSHDAIRAYIIRRARALGAMDLIPDDWTSGKSYVTKDAASLAQGVDAALDEACELVKGVDTTTLPENVAQALGLITAAAETVDELLDAMNVDDPDDEDAATGDAAPAAAGDAAKQVDAEVLELKNRLSLIEIGAVAG